MISISYASFEKLGLEEFSATSSENIFLNPTDNQILIVGQDNCMLINVDRALNQDL